MNKQLINILIYIGNRLFYFQTNRKRKIDNNKIGCKKGCLSFYSVCMFVCVYVCLFVCWRSTDVIV